MTVGVQIFNKHQTIQITNNDYPYVLLKSTRIDSSHKWNTSNGISYIENALGMKYRDDFDDIVTFYYCSNKRIMCSLSATGRLYKWHNQSLGQNDYIDIYAFTRIKPRERGRSGLQLFNRERGLVFDSSWYILNITGFYVIPPQIPSVANLDINNIYQINTHFDNGRYAVALSTYKQAYFFRFSPYEFIEAQNAIWMDGSTIKINWIPINRQKRREGIWASQSGFGQKNETYAYVIDTTNLPIPYEIRI